MKTVARLSAEDRSDLFRNTANRMQMSDAIVEKDFWVCFTLDYLFHRSPWKDSITFKGGTSLSKAYHLINRFSEDIDLILDWREGNGLLLMAVVSFLVLRSKSFGFQSFNQFLAGRSGHCSILINGIISDLISQRWYAQEFRINPGDCTDNLPGVPAREFLF